LTSDPRKPIVHGTEEEARFLFRTRVLNPKWIEGTKRHGHKGAGEGCLVHGMAGEKKLAAAE
jgi:cobaltochelatase CobN